MIRLFGLLAVLIAVPAYGQFFGGSSSPSVATSAKATLTFPAETVNISASASAEAETAQGAADGLHPKTAAIAAALERLGLGDLPRSGYSVDAVRDGETDELLRYEASLHFDVQLSDPARLGEVIDELLAAGVDNIWNVQFGLRDREPARKEALLKALAVARQEAELLATAAGAKLGAIESLSTGDVSSVSYSMGSVGRLRRSATTVPISDVTVSAEVRARWGLVAPEE
jgi:hypothetical protein